MGPNRMGGPNALIDTKISVKGMAEVIDSLVLKILGDFIITTDLQYLGKTLFL